MKSVQGADYFIQSILGYMGVDFHSLARFMAQQRLNVSQVGALCPSKCGVTACLMPSFFIATINSTLRRNRSIFKSPNPAGKSTVWKEYLELQGFEFR